ncbi:rod shape-determining protein [Alteromonas flava]|uniref:rod shape-determining protein n=1 Tax=Alteromonas flava TaxID=2048003 RepID=UPI000C28D4A2|nr:rod shape-determining protein [Alteromonas flava]
MFSRLKSRFSESLYVQMWEKRIKVTNLSANAVFDDSPLVVIQTKDNGKKIVSGIGKLAASSLKENEVAVNPFSHPRALLSDFYVGEVLLKHIFLKLSSNKYIRPNPKVIMHPMEKTEGGLTQIEKRAYRELALGGGAKEIKIHVGSTLNVHNLKYEDYKDSESDVLVEATNDVSTNVVTFLFYLALIVLAVWYFGN